MNGLGIFAAAVLIFLLCAFMVSVISAITKIADAFSRWVDKH